MKLQDVHLNKGIHTDSNKRNHLSDEAQLNNKQDDQQSNMKFDKERGKAKRISLMEERWSFLFVIVVEIATWLSAIIGRVFFFFFLFFLDLFFHHSKYSFN